MFAAIVLIIVGIAIAIAAHRYITEQVFRFVGIALGIVVIAYGAYLLVTSASDSDAELDSSLNPALMLTHT